MYIKCITIIKLFLIYLLSVLFALGFFCCAEKNENQEQFMREDVTKVFDSIGVAKVVASFNEDNCFCVLVTDNVERKTVKKLTYRKGYPIFIDTLVYTKINELKSQRFKTTYKIKNTTVLKINFVKIIHPSSNWQGQTPWEQPYINTYLRTDKKNYSTKQ